MLGAIPSAVPFCVTDLLASAVALLGSSAAQFAVYVL